MGFHEDELRLRITSAQMPSGGFRNSERGVQPLAREARLQIFGLPRPLSVTLEVQTEYLKATLASRPSQMSGDQ